MQCQWAVACLCYLLKELCLKSDIVHESAKAVIDVQAHVEHEQTLTIDFVNAIRASKAELEDASAFVGKLRNPIGHLHESNCAAGLNHGAGVNRPRPLWPSSRRVIFIPSAVIHIPYALRPLVVLMSNASHLEIHPNATVGC